MNTKSNRIFHIVLWIFQILLAAMYLMAGGTKLFQSIEQLTPMLPWVANTPVGMVRFIGLSEVLGGFGLLLPSLLRIQPKLTYWAAVGLALIQLLAIGFHLSRGEVSVVGFNFILLALAGFIAWGRSQKVPILPK